MTTNKEAIAKLQSYLVKQDPYVLSRALAAFMIDMNRIYYIRDLPDDEYDNLFDRVEKNVKELHAFLNDESDGPLVIHNMDSTIS